MSFLATEWAGDDAPVADIYERCILSKLANHASKLGTGAWPSKATMAKTALCDTKTVQRKLNAMQRRGLIARGDQRLVSHLRADRRPVVYDLLIPRSWYSNQQWTTANDERETAGYDRIDPATRPDIAEPTRTGRAPRSDARHTNRADINTDAPEGLADSGELHKPTGGLAVPSHGGTNSPPVDSDLRGDSQSSTGGLAVPHGGTNSPPNQYLENQSVNPSIQPSDDEPDDWMDGWMDGDPDDKPDGGHAVLARAERSIGGHLVTRRDEYARSIAAALPALGEQRILRILTDNVRDVHNPAGVLVTRIAGLPEHVDAQRADNARRAEQRRAKPRVVTADSTPTGPDAPGVDEHASARSEPGTGQLSAQRRAEQRWTPTGEHRGSVEAWASVPSKYRPPRLRGQTGEEQATRE